MKNIRIFISNVQKEFAQERAALRDYLRGGTLFSDKKLCRYYFKIDPVATASYVYAYREIWDEEEDFKPLQE